MTASPDLHAESAKNSCLPSEEEIAAFLKLRDEMVPDPDERTDEERRDSARAILDLIRPAVEAMERQRVNLYDALESIEDRNLDRAEWASRCAERRVDAENRWAQVALENSDLTDALSRAEARALAAEAALAKAVVFEIGEHQFVESRGDGTWAIKNGGCVLNVDGVWEYEPSPSNRTPEFIARTRFGLAEAMARARSAVEGARGEKPRS